MVGGPFQIRVESSLGVFLRFSVSHSDALQGLQLCVYFSEQTTAVLPPSQAGCPHRKAGSRPGLSPRRHCQQFVADADGSGDFFARDRDVLEAAPPTDVIHEHSSKVGLARGYIFWQAPEAWATRQIDPAPGFVGIHPPSTSRATWHMAAIGRKGGQIGGKRLTTMSKEQFGTISLNSFPDSLHPWS